MSKFDIHILGCGSAKPSEWHSPSAQLIDVHDRLYMLDCGEGTQMQLIRHSHDAGKLSLRRLVAIFITHLHGDHCFGLPGLLSTLDLLGRKGELHIFSPDGLEKAIKAMLSLSASQFTLGFDIKFHAVDTTKYSMIYSDNGIEVFSLPLTHRIPCCGYLIKEHQSLPHIRHDVIEKYKIPYYALQGIRQGESWTTADGLILRTEQLTVPASPSRSYAYCTDTSPTENIVQWISGTNLLYHDSTFGDDAASRANATFHSTARDAALIAKKANVKSLLLGHFSSRYDYEKEKNLLKQAQEIFPNSSLANEFEIYKL